LTACFLVVSAGAATAKPLDGLILFDDPYHCSPSKDFEALLGGVVRWEAAGNTYEGMLAEPPVPAAFRKHIGKPKLTIKGNEYRATVPVRGSWQGLPLRSLVVVEWVESETGFYLVFDATREQVRDAANRAGFRIPQAGSEYRDEDVVGTHVGVENYGGRAALYCVAG
jgi:hypothetical protein